MSSPLQTFIDPLRERVNQLLETWTLAADSVAPRITEAMQYSLLNGGKRIRPVLCYAAAKAVGEISEATHIGAAAVECIHAYSLVHDDLPAMDDDDLRRGKATCHIAFNEGTAILAGDGLQTLAFEKLAAIDSGDPALVLAMIRELALASGDKGMVAGQMLDIDAEGQPDTLSFERLKKIHRHKTGALIRAAVLMGAWSAAASADQRKRLSDYSEAIGLAFQIQDDIIDVTSDTETLGKRQGADAALGKPTYVTLLGIEQAKQSAKQLHANAIQSLEDFDESADPLRWIADYIVTRNH